MYLIVGSALAIASLVVVGYDAQWADHLAALPYATMGAMVLWFTLGAWVIGQQQRKLIHNHDLYVAHVQRHARPTPPPASVDTLTSDAPWELHAFWGHRSSASQPSPKPEAHTAGFWVPAAAQMPRSSPADLAVEKLHPLDFVVTAVHRPERPISLFGDAQ